MWLILGLAPAVIIACEPAPVPDPIRSTVAASTVTVARPLVASQTTLTPVAVTQSTMNAAAPPPPTPEPTMSAGAINIADWQRIGAGTGILEVLAPAEWVDLSGEINVSDAANQLGLTVLLITDSAKTGTSILAGKELISGAFFMAMVAGLEWPADDPIGALDQLVARLGPAAETAVLSTPVEAYLPSNVSPSLATDDGVLAASLDITGDPAGFFASGGVNMRNTLLLIPLDLAEKQPGNEAQAVFLFTAPSEQWARFAPTFERMMEAITVSGNELSFTINDGAAMVLGTLHPEEAAINGKLERGVKDIYLFKASGKQYSTLTLTPTDRDIDLAMTVIDPAGQVVAAVDSGYVGIAEVAADIFLAEQGQYIVQIAEFSGGSGRYTLDLALTNSPAIGNTGSIEFGQGIQGRLPENARHIWTFSGTAGQLVSIVLAPIDEQLDVILHLYDPEGHRLVALDEGFSGDAEVISGFELPVTGKYSIQVRSFAGNGGIYTLSLNQGGEEIRNFYDAGDLSDGAVKQETLRIDEAHAWFFQAKAGDSVTIEVVPLDQGLDLDLWLLDPSIRRIVAEDRFMAGVAETIRSTIGQDGQYLLFVRDFQGNPGAYEVRFSQAREDNPEEVGTLAYGEPVTATLRAGQTAVWRFRGDVDDVVDITLAPLGNDTDLLFALQDPGANTIIEVDKALAGDEETLNGFTIAANGLWQIVIKEFFGEAGSYVLMVKRSQP